MGSRSRQSFHRLVRHLGQDREGRLFLTGLSLIQTLHGSSTQIIPMLRSELRGQEMARTCSGHAFTHPLSFLAIQTLSALQRFEILCVIASMEHPQKTVLCAALHSLLGGLDGSTTGLRRIHSGAGGATLSKRRYGNAHPRLTARTSVCGVTCNISPTVPRPSLSVTTIDVFSCIHRMRLTK